MEMSLKNREWKEFLFPEIFEIKKGFYNKKPLTSNKGNIPFLGATQNNNGITDFFTIKEIDKSSKVGYGKNEPLQKKIFKGNCIAVTNNGSVGHAYYQVSDFTCSHDINPLYLKDYDLNKYIAMFLIASIEKQKVCFEYARKWRPIRMVKSKILLPVNSQGKPDFEYMEKYMREKKQEKLNAYKNYIFKRIEELEQTKNIVSLSEKQWEEFYLSEIFTQIQRGKRLKKGDHIKGKIPYVSSTALNNGIDNFIGNKENVRNFSNCLSIANSGSVGACFYHPYNFIASDHITKLENNDFNKYIYLFLSSITTRLGEKYSFNREINDTRIKREKILLPINENKEPDFEFMENYMKHLELRKLKKYLEYKKSDERNTV
jgi:hypothetical protein